MAWMAWTLPSALFFIGIACALALLTLAEMLWPTVSRRGFLGFATTRGDRFFIALLSSAFVHVLWLGLTALPVWWISLLCLGLVASIMRWG